MKSWESMIDAGKQGWLSSIVVCLTAIFVFFSGFLRPDFDWDVIGYVAAAHHADGLRGVELHAATYRDIRDAVGERHFETLTDEADVYRRTVYSDPQALEQNVPFYSIRVAFVGLIRLVGALGVSYTQADVLLNSSFAALSVLAFYMFFARARLPVLLFPLLVMLAGFRLVAKLSTPDAFACLMSLLLLDQAWRGSRWTLLLAVFLPLVRTDFSLFSILVLLGVYFFRRREFVYLLMVPLVFVVSSLINKEMGNYGFLTIFNFTLIQKWPWPQTMQISHDVKDYVRVYQGGLWSFWESRQLLWYLMGGWLVFCGRSNIEGRGWLLPFCCFGFVLCHMALFPVYLDRFFVSCVALIALDVVRTLRDAAVCPR